MFVDEKLSYFCTQRSGASHIRNLAFINNKTCNDIHEFKTIDTCPFASVVYNPPKQSLTWYWEDKSKTIECDYNVDIEKIMSDSKIKPRPKTPFFLRMIDDEHHAPFTHATTTPTWHKSFDKAFECDLIIHPLPLLGFISKNTMNEDLRSDRRLLNVDIDYSVDQFRKRRNIIPYKEDIRHWVKQWFVGSACYNDNYFESIRNRIKNAMNFARDVKIMLNRYDIRYEMFSLDTGDYKSLGFNKLLSRRNTDYLDNMLPSKYMDKVDSWVDEYMSEYHEV